MSAETNPFHQWINLAQPRLGAKVVYANDEFFAAKERLIDAAEPVFIDGKYDAHGKWMDGWESRRKRGPGHDFCIVRLGVAGMVHGIDINTRYFTGNFPPEASLEACRSDDEIPDDDTQWQKLVAKTRLQGDSHNWINLSGEGPFSHFRFNIFPDGGVARLRVYGAVQAEPNKWENETVDLFALRNGGRALYCSDEHYGSMHNLNLPDRSLNMGDGWETARRRGAGNDWVILALAATGEIESIEVDTQHFKGNYPDRVAIDAVALSEDAGTTGLLAEKTDWQPLLPESKLEMDRQHIFTDLNSVGPVSH
ncbi:MAG: allantoicase, partial [Gammaproteobacteria bacterium]|nr:allantoicase [Gammaproteobacteria bacterium]